LVKWLIHQFDASSICCFAKLPFLKTCCFVNLLFYQLAIPSSWHFVSSLFPHFAYLSTWHFIKLVFCQLTFSSLITLPICQLAI
jgi:hypothetical protein